MQRLDQINSLPPVVENLLCLPTPVAESLLEIDESDDYSTFMRNLSPCSSRATLDTHDNPVEYNPVEFTSLLEHRNNLCKLGTLIDDVAVQKFEGISRTNTLKSNSSGDIALEDVELKVLSTNDKVMSVKFDELLRFINTYITIKPVEVNIIHFLIYLSHKLKKSISSFKLCHLGKCYTVNCKLDLAKKGLELSSIKVQKYPTFHLSIADTNVSSLKMAVNELISKTLEQEYYPVTYVDVITHNISSSKLKSKLKNRFKRLVRA